MHGLTVLVFLCVVTACSRSAGSHEPSIPRDAAIEKKVKAQLSKMTLDDKIGQMLQLNLDQVGSARRFGGGAWTVNDAALDSVIGKYRTGSVLNTPGGRAATVEHWRQIIGRIQQESMETLGIPCIYGLDQNHGASYVQGAHKSGCIIQY